MKVSAWQTGGRGRRVGGLMGGGLLVAAVCVKKSVAVEARLRDLDLGAAGCADAELEAATVVGRDLHQCRDVLQQEACYVQRTHSCRCQKVGKQPKLLMHSQSALQDAEFQHVGRWDFVYSRDTPVYVRTKYLVLLCLYVILVTAIYVH